VSLIPHLPIRGNDFIFEIGHNTEKKFVGDICVRGSLLEASGSDDKCLGKLTRWHTSYHPLWIKISGICDTIEPDFERRSNVSVRFDTEHFTNGQNSFWQGYIFPDIKVKLTTTWLYQYSEIPKCTTDFRCNSIKYPIQ
jgi:hypothetical protein